MAQITIKNLTFAYPNTTKNALEDISISVEKGEFVLVCGTSGCGKTTFLRSIKKSIAPFGNQKGTIIFKGKNLDDMSLREEASEIGFVFQKPEHQIVTDKVWHELAFGLENVGMKSDDIKLRVAEMADYFGLTKYLYDEVEHLSGGQKQLLNIASVMAMQPSVVILDEPTAQLDPIMAENLLSIIYRVNRDFGTTIIISEHRLSNVMYMATKMIVLDHGKIILEGKPEDVAGGVKNTEFLKVMPEIVKVYCKYEKGNHKCPLTVGEARRWLETSGKRSLILEREAQKSECNQSFQKSVEQAIEIKNIWFRYERNSKDVIKGMSLSVNRGEIFGIVGGNGSGKSTMLSIMCGIHKAYRGKIKIMGSVSMLVQDVQCLFLKETVMEELSIADDKNLINEVLNLMELGNYRDVHPYDLSGGEQQRLGMAKLLLMNPDIILLDEPTKGMDGIFKDKFGELLMILQRKGKTIIIVSHDIEFISKYTDRCGMFFDGTLIAVNHTKEFVKGNRHYTTEKEKLLRE